MSNTQYIALALLLTAGACAQTRAAGPATTQAAPPAVQTAGRLEHEAIRESSGLVASRTQDGVFWTHNDSGNPAVLYAVKADGALVAEFPVDKAPNVDWEDIAADDGGFLYVGDLGNNARKRVEVLVHRIREPRVQARGQRLAPDRTWRLRYAGEPFDCEALFVHDGHGYLISKQRDAGRARVWRFSLAAAGEATLEAVTTLSLRWPVTAADVSGDGKLLAVMTVAGPYVFRIDGDVARAGRARPRHTGYWHLQMEACCFVPGGLLATTEARDMLRFTDRRLLEPPAGPADAD